MMIPVELTAGIEHSTLRDGTQVVTARVLEMPGVVAEGANEQQAVEELLFLVRNLHDRNTQPVVGLKTPSVAGWSWAVSAGMLYGAGADVGALHQVG